MSALTEIAAGVHLPSAAAKWIFGTHENVTAVGTTASDGYQVRTRSVDITGGSGKCVVLPAAVGDGIEIYFIRNSSGNTNEVIPPSGGTINALSANSGYSMATAKSAVFIAKSASAYYTIPIVAS